MKNLILFLTLTLSSLAFSQAPEGINYQAVIRNSSGNLVTSTTIAIRVQVRQTSSTGTVVYQERHSVTTTSQGLVNFVIGGGMPQTGTFNAINWSVGPYFVNLGVDLTGGANGVNYQDFGTQQLMSVPYALYAKNSGNQVNQWRNGTTAPPIALGVLGDYFLNTVTGDVYYKNSATTWVLTGNIKGPQGPSGTQGPQGIAGSAGINGSNGQNTLVNTTLEPAGANCLNGGVKIEYGLDANNNGTLDLSEINASLTKYVCNGAVGVTGAAGTIGPQGPAGPAGVTGPQGPTGATGPQGPIGLTGPAGPQGVAGTNGANGTNGVDGKNTLAKTTTEAAGANCTTGGVKIEYGLDANNNGTLDLSEINASLTKYVCNGAVGTTGATGLTGATGPQGPIGLTGPAGAAGPQGVAGTNGTNGTNGVDGKNTLAKTTTEAAGANCTTGGVKIEYGLDANNNGTLDLSEINASLTKYVCNGAVGATGAIGPQGPQGPAGSGGFSHFIGEEYGGGVIFHLWKDAQGAEHGLIVDLTDISTSQIWSNITTSIGSSAQSTWNGQSNSNAIVAQAGHTSSAAKLCLDLVSGGTSDWYLPSIDELILLWNNRFNVNKTLSSLAGATIIDIYNNYWSSTEDYNFAWSLSSYYGYPISYNKSYNYHVRAIRSF